MPCYFTVILANTNYFFLLVILKEQFWFMGDKRHTFMVPNISRKSETLMKKLPFFGSLV